jgi:hypothetical protein
MSQQRKQIFLDASLWSHRWFDDMPIEHQMAYIILWAESDNVGVWKPHFRELNFKLKESIDPEAFLSNINKDQKRIEVLENGDWWLIEYLPLQVSTLTPNNRPHVSYIEDLRAHGLLSRYAKENPDNVKFEVIQELSNWDDIENFEEKKRAKAAFQYLKKKGLVRPLQEACKTLARGIQDSKEKDKEKEKDQEKDEDKGKDQEKSLTPNSLVQANGSPNVYETIKKNIGGLALVDVGSLTFQKDVDLMLEELSESDVKDPAQYLIEKMQKVDWMDTSWDEFTDQILSVEETPF